MIEKMISKMDEMKEEYVANREAGIKNLCQISDVSYDDYIKAI